MTDTTISADTDLATLINVFTVAPERQRQLIELLSAATEQVMRHRPGFVSANLHASIDGTQVANYAQWASVDAFEAMLSDPECQEHMSAARRIAEVQPQVYRVAATHHA